MVIYIIERASYQRVSLRNPCPTLTQGENLAQPLPNPYPRGKNLPNPPCPTPPCPTVQDTLSIRNSIYKKVQLNTN